MAFIPQIDVLDANGNSLIQTNPDGTVPDIQVQLGQGLVGTFSKDGDLGTIRIDATEAASLTSLEIGSSYTETGSTGAAPWVQVTTDATVTNLGPPVAVAAGQGVYLRAIVVVNLIGDGTNPASLVAVLRLKVAARKSSSGTTIVHPSSGDDGSLTAGPIAVASPVTTAATGKLSVHVGFGGVLQLQVEGSTYGSVPAWQAATSYVGGDLVTNDSGKVYVCTNGGTSAGSGGPTGTAGAIGDGASVPQLTWAFVENDAKLTVRWTLALLEVITG